MPSLLPHVDPEGLLEYSVVYTDRALNHMSMSFRNVMLDISNAMKDIYKAQAVVVVPGSGTFGMEAVARQFANNEKCLIIRNGWFSYRWTQILEMGQIPSSSIVMKASPIEEGKTPYFEPAPIDEVIQTILQHKPKVVFAPHVETSAGMILPDDYIRQLGKATRDVGGLLVLDCIASGTIWADMTDLNVDILITAPQKGWSGSPCAGIVMLGERALEKLPTTQNTSFACNLAKWLQIMQAYEQGKHAYHATMPTDALKTFRDVIIEAQQYGVEKLKQNQQELGKRIRSLLEQKGFKSVAAKNVQSPSVIVSYTNNPTIKNGSAFAQVGIQIAAGVPLQCNEPEGFQTFRLGLFGLDKLKNIDRTVSLLEDAFQNITP